MSDTLNIFDFNETRTPTLIVEEIKAISFQERAGCAGGGKGILIQIERTGALSTLNNQYVCYDPNDLPKEENDDKAKKQLRDR